MGKAEELFSGGEQKPKTTPEVSVDVTGRVDWGHLCHGDTCFHDGQS